MNSRRLGAVLAVAVAMGLLGQAGAQDEASQEAAAICKNPQCPGIVGAWQQDIKTCGSQRERMADLQGKLEICLPGRADAEKRAQDAEDRVAELKKEVERLQKVGKDFPDAGLLTKAVETARNEAGRLKAENDKLQQQIDRLTEELARQSPGGKKPPVAADEKKKSDMAAVEEKTQPEATSRAPGAERKQAEATTRAPGEGSDCVTLSAPLKGVCFVKTRAPGWLMARTGFKADEGSTLFLRPFIDPGVIPRLPQAGGSGECRPLRDVLKSLQPLDPRPSVDAVFVRSGDAVAQCYDTGEGDWKLRPLSKGDRKHQAWILVPETRTDGSGVRP